MVREVLFPSDDLALVTFATGAELLIGVDAGLMPIFPDGCQAIASYRLYVYQRCFFNAQALFIV